MTRSSDYALKCRDITFNVVNIEGIEDPDYQKPRWTLSINDTSNQFYNEIQNELN